MLFVSVEIHSENSYGIRSKKEFIMEEGDLRRLLYHAERYDADAKLRDRAYKIRKEQLQERKAR